MKRYALTAIGRDKAGIVGAVTKALYEHDCNIEDSSMTTLQDEFAIILIMSAPDTSVEGDINKTLKAVEEEFSLSIHLKMIDEKSHKKTPPSTHIVTVSGYDKPGIVYKTTEFLAKWSINIKDLETKIVGGEAQNIYIMLLEVHFPKTLDEDAITGSLKTLGDSMGVAIEIKPVETYESL
jgi:glycine cleavage system transcriptional repressor